jgi:hypothetical protein
MWHCLLSCWSPLREAREQFLFHAARTHVVPGIEGHHRARHGARLPILSRSIFAAVQSSVHKPFWGLAIIWLQHHEGALLLIERWRPAGSNKAPPRHARDMGATSSKLPVHQLLNLSKDKSAGLHKYRFSGGTKQFRAPFHVCMAELLHVRITQELEKSLALARRNDGIIMGGEDSDGDSDETPLVAMQHMQLVINGLNNLFLLFTPDVKAARARRHSQ